MAHLFFLVFPEWGAKRASGPVGDDAHAVSSRRNSTELWAWGSKRRGREELAYHTPTHAVRACEHPAAID